jgi:glycosyltransferase involved in cell wall biosynthesis
MIIGYGVDLVTNKFAEGLSELGHDVTVYCNFADGTYSYRNYEMNILGVPSSSKPFEYELSAEKAIKKYVLDEDIWIVETFPFFKAASNFKHPWIAHDHGVVPSESFPRKKRQYFDFIRKTQYEKYFQNSSKIICVSNFLRGCLPTSLRKKADVVYLGIDHYGKDVLVDSRRELDLRGIVIMYVGRTSDNEPYKGVEDLLETYSRLKDQVRDVELLIATSCSIKEQSRLEKKGVRVLNGILSPFMPSVFKSANIYATATKWEGFDLPLLEASYYGLPIVAFSIGAHPEVVRTGKTGYLVKDKSEFKRRIIQLIKDDELRYQMGTEGKKFASEFKWENATKSLDKIIKEIVE